MAVIPATPNTPEKIYIDDQAIKMMEAAKGVADCISDLGRDSLPEHYKLSLDRFQSARAILQAPDQSGFEWPAKITDLTLAKAIKTEADRRVSDHMARIVAAEAAEAAANQSLGSLRDALPEGIDRMNRDFKQAATDFMVAAASAPARLSGRDDPEQITAFVARIDAANRLEAIVNRRVGVGNAMQEARSGSGVLWPFAAVPETVHTASGEMPADEERIYLLRDIAASFQMHQRVWLDMDLTDKWTQMLAVITPSICPFGQMQNRADRWDQVMRLAQTDVQMTGLGDMDRRATIPGRQAAQLARRIAELQPIAA